MLSTSVPSRIQLPFANAGVKNAIPVPSQIATDPALASYTDGFPPATRTPLAAGGKPPYGADMNGILAAITAIQQYQSAGGLFPYDSTFSTAVGGYPKGAHVISSDRTKVWQSTAENNTTNPDAGGANWIAVSGVVSELLSSSGYKKIPGSSLIVQWGQMTISHIAGTSTPYTFTFPTAFPTAMLQGWLSPGSNVAGISQPVSGSVESLSATSCAGYVYSTDAAPRTWRFLVIGY